MTGCTESRILGRPVSMLHYAQQSTTDTSERSMTLHTSRFSGEHSIPMTVALGADIPIGENYRPHFIHRVDLQALPKRFGQGLICHSRLLMSTIGFQIRLFSSIIYYILWDNIPNKQYKAKFPKGENNGFTIGVITSD